MLDETDRLYFIDMGSSRLMSETKPEDIKWVVSSDYDKSSDFFPWFISEKLVPVFEKLRKGEKGKSWEEVEEDLFPRDVRGTRIV